MDNNHYLQELSFLHKIVTIVDQSIDMRSVVHPILEALDENLGFPLSTITLLRQNGDEILIEASHGLTHEQAELGHYKLGEGVIGKVILSGEEMIIPRISESTVFLNRTRAARDPDTAYICVPIKEKQVVVGALSVYRRFAPMEQLKEDATILGVVASMLARAVLLRRSMLEEQATLKEENRQLRAELSAKFHPANIVGNSREMQGVYDQIEQVAKSQATVLITGETGTGKELVANAIHYASTRAKEPFVRVHCAALPESLIESELFGHVKGAFTGAISDRIGRFELANGGTIFLDEIGEVPLSIQAKLLRVIQEREFERVGSTKTIKVNVRIIAATHRDLPKMVEEGKFREDLYYRLSVFPIFVPPLRKRKADIILLADHFLKKYAKENGNQTIAKFSNEAIDMLMAYSWPGNVRELENCIERCVLLTKGEVVDAGKLPSTVQVAESGEPAAVSSGPQIVEGASFAEMVGGYEKAILQEALALSHNNIAAAARLLRSTPRIVSYKAHQHGLV